MRNKEYLETLNKYHSMQSKVHNIAVLEEDYFNFCICKIEQLRGIDKSRDFVERYDKIQTKIIEMNKLLTDLLTEEMKQNESI